MLSKNQSQIWALVGLIATTESDQMTCDDCFGQISEFVELAIRERTHAEGMGGIQRHLEQCPCCQNEYVALVQALQEVTA